MENINKTVAFCNLGCKVNAYETESLIEQLKNKDYKVVPFGNPAFITIINTCTVTNMADRKSRQMLHRARKMAPDGVVIAMGCYVQVMKKEDIKMETDVDIFIGNNEKDKLIEILESYLKEHKVTEDNKSTQEKIAKNVINIEKEDKLKKITDAKIYIEDINKQGVPYENLVLTGTSKHTRAYMKIQDGCNQFCSYCLIPYARGRVRSKEIDVIENEAKGLIEKGFKEIVLTGIHLSSYGLDKGNIGLVDVIKIFEKLQGDTHKFRLRLGSLEPRIICKEFLESLKAVRGFCPHFHLSLQSGCDKTLKAMNRKYSAAEFKEKVELIRKFWKDAAITTDVIVGFPGESEEDFEESKKFVESVNFAQTHIFKFSKRKGTKAYDMDGQVDEDIKTKRSHVLISLDEKRREEFGQRFKGKEVEVLIEESKEIDGKWFDIGHTPEYIQVKLSIKKEDKDKRDNTFITIEY